LTLFEICLVLALLITIGTITVPLMSGSIARRALVSGADLLRAACSRARLAAMKSGEVHVLRCEPHGSRFEVVSFDRALLPESQELTPDDPDADFSPPDLLRLRTSRLPEGVIFASADISGSNQLKATSDLSDEGPWSTPILFRPDGTTSDATFLLVHESGRTIRVTLRGLTGTTNATAVGREAAP
jgi:hypothetical protein